MVRAPKAIFICGIFIAICLGSIVTVGFQSGQQSKQKQAVKRSRKPKFTQKDWNNIFFENLFEQGLEGPRPTTMGQTQKNGLANADGSSLPTTDSGSNENSGGFAWSSFIPGDVIENEVKKLQLQLEKDVTTPVRFKSNYAKARQSYSMLSMLFGLIRVYDAEVRWKKYAPEAQVTFKRTADNAKVGTQQSYQSAKRRKDELTDLVRGGTFTGSDKAPETLEWPNVVDRSPLMNRLQTGQDTVKPALANNTEFKKNIDMIRHEAAMFAVIGQILLQEDMDEYDEDEYSEYSNGMSDAAKALVEACKTENYDAASTAFNLIEQSCSNCHDFYR